MEKTIEELGFDSLEEFNRLVASVDLTSTDKLKAFRNWNENDGTKEGLLLFDKQNV